MSKESPAAKPTPKTKKSPVKKNTPAKAIVLDKPKNFIEAFLKSGGAIGVTLGVFFFGQLVPALFAVVALGLAGNDTDQISDILRTNVSIQLVVTVSIAIFTSVLFWKLLRLRGHDPKKFLLLDKRPTMKQAGEVALTFGVYYITLIAALILVDILTPININQQQQLGVASTAGSGLIAVFIMLVVIPPIFEEIVFRGFLYRYLKGFSGVVAAYILTSVIFGAAHLEFGNRNWVAAIDTLIFSGYLIYISQKHKSLYSAILLHAIKNGIAFYVLFLR